MVFVRYGQAFAYPRVLCAAAKTFDHPLATSSPSSARDSDVKLKQSLMENDENDGTLAAEVAVVAIMLMFVVSYARRGLAT